MNDAEREHQRQRLAHVIRPEDPGSLAAYGLARAALDLVQDRSEEQCKALAAELDRLSVNYPRT